MGNSFDLRQLCRRALLGVVLASPAHANLIVNGSFETGPAATDAVELAAGSTAIAGWAVTPSNIDYVGTRWSAAQGVRSIGLNGSSPGGIAQIFQTVPSAKYVVRFWMCGDPVSSPVIKHVRVSAAGQSAVFAADISGAWAWDPGWNSHLFHFVANTASTTLTFSSLETGNTGPAIDSVTVTTTTPVDAGPQNGVEFALSPMSPNPVLDVGQVDFGVSHPGAVMLRVLDVSGREVAVLAKGQFTPGVYHASWDGRGGVRRAPAGVYLVELRTASERRVQRVVLLR